MHFKKFNLHQNILKALLEAGYEKPTQIRSDAIPKVLEGCDLFASAQTGTGKTAAFILPALHLLTKAPLPGGGPRVVILVLTRELGSQVVDQAVKYSKYVARVKTVCIYG